ncbi:Mucin-2 [Xylographa trunciseda]|nr:Mucin-2 [Xylographa trunciseda]
MYITSGLLAALAVQLSLATPVQRREIPADRPSKLEVVAGLKAAGVVAKRALPTCNHDNLFRIFLDARYSSSASAFCSYYIESTSTVTATTVPVIPVTSIVTLPASVTDFVTVTPAAMKKRSASATPTAPDGAATYPASRLSSACSCLVTPSTVTTTSTVTSPSTTTVTLDVTAAAPTETVFAPAAYCGQIIAGATTGLGYVAECGVTYTGDSPGSYETAASYTDCLNLCDNDGYCGYFSFLLTATTDNCYLVDSYDPNNPALGFQFEPSMPDNAVNSGMFILDNTS